MNNINIGRVAAAANLRASAIRYYESEGLLPPAHRRFPVSVGHVLDANWTCLRTLSGLGTSLSKVLRCMFTPISSSRKERWRGHSQSRHRPVATGPAMSCSRSWSVAAPHKYHLRKVGRPVDGQPSDALEIPVAGRKILNSAFLGRRSDQ